MKHENKENLLVALRDFASFGGEGVEVAVDLVEKLGRDAYLLRSVEQPTRLTPEEFEENKQVFYERAKLLGISERELPQKYEEYVAFVEEAAQFRGLIKKFSIKYPDDMQKDQIGLVAVDMYAHEQYLPGIHLAGYGREVVLGSQGIENGHQRILFSSQDCDSFWFGMELLHACWVALCNIEDDSMEKMAVDLHHSMFERKKTYPSEEKVAIQIAADNSLARFFTLKFPEFENLLDSFKSSFQIDFLNDFQVQELVESIRGAIRCVLKEIVQPNFGKSSSALEKQVREVLVAKMVCCKLMPLSMLMKFYLASGMAMPSKPFVQVA